MVSYPRVNSQKNEQTSTEENEKAEEEEEEEEEKWKTRLMFWTHKQLELGCQGYNFVGVLGGPANVGRKQKFATAKQMKKKKNQENKANKPSQQRTPRLKRWSRHQHTATAGWQYAPAHT